MTPSQKTTRLIVQGQCGEKYRKYHLSSQFPENRWPALWSRVDRMVAQALGADLLPDGEDGHRWFNDPGPRVEVSRLRVSGNIKPFDPDGSRRLVLPKSVKWVNAAREVGTSQWDGLTFGEALRLPVEQIALMRELSLLDGLVRYYITMDAQLTLHKGLAWSWGSINLSAIRQLLTGYPLAIAA